MARSPPVDADRLAARPSMNLVSTQHACDRGAHAPEGTALGVSLVFWESRLLWGNLPPSVSICFDPGQMNLVCSISASAWSFSSSYANHGSHRSTGP